MSPHHNLARRSSNARLAAQQERQQKLKLVNSEHDTLVETPKQNKLKLGAIKLPKITPKARDFSPMSMNDANESSILSHKRRAVPKRARDNITKAMSPVHDKSNDYTSRMSGLSSHFDMDPPKRYSNRKPPAGRNQLPKIN